MLHQDADEALKRTVNSAVNRDRSDTLPRLIHILKVEALREHRKVHLNRCRLPLTAECVAHDDVDLWRVEGTVARVEAPLGARSLQRRFNHRFGLLPELRIAERLCRLRGEDELDGEIKPAVDRGNLTEQGVNLALNLIRSHVDVSVVLNEVTHARQAAQRPREFVAVQSTVLCEAQRKVAVAARLCLIDDGALRAVHRLQAELLTFRFNDEHVFAVELPVSRLLPETLADNDRRGDLLITARVLQLAHRALKCAPEELPLRVPEGAAGGDIMEGEEVERHTESSVITLLHLIATPDELIELLLCVPGSPVDALQHRPIALATPVRTSD